MKNEPIAIPLSISELRYRRLFEAAHDGIMLIDPATRRIVDVNPFLVRFLGYTHQELVGRELFEIGLLKDEAASQTAFLQLRETGYIRYEDLPLQTKDARRVDVEFVSNLYQEGDHQIIQCNVRDITERKQNEKALRDADLKLTRHAEDLERLVRVRTAELRLSNTQLETFVYSIAHDLRAPLRSMQGFSQLLTENHWIKQEGSDYMNLINTAAQTMDRLLADLLDFSHISQQEMLLFPVELGPIVRNALAACETEIRESHAVIQNPIQWPTVLAHPAALQQVLVNLIGNALKFVRDKAPEVRLRWEIRPHRIVRIWVEDNGIGIAPEFQRRIFEVFQRLHTMAYAGTGIGLAIVQKGVERMGGQVGVDSAPGKGSRFWIDLSQAAPAAEIVQKTNGLS